jgi:hypothetical protein
MLVPDFMHEFELGTWKATLTHLIRILHASGGDLIPRFNERFLVSESIHNVFTRKKSRFHLVPTFGRDTIRKFSCNVSDLTKLAARDFEDLLQVKY